MGGTMPYKRFLDRNRLAEGGYDWEDPLGSIRGDLRRMERDFPEVWQIGVARPLLPDDDAAANTLGLAHCAVYHEHRLREDACADSLEEAGLLIAALRREVGE
jgi:hypothetical protein